MSDNKKVGNSLLALSSAAVLAVYAAGYVRTRAAAERFAEQTEARIRPTVALPANEIPGAGATTLNAPAHNRETPSRVAANREPEETREPERKLRRKKTTELIVRAPEVPPPPTALAAAAAPVEPRQPQEPEPTARLESREPADTKPSAPQWKDGTYDGWGTSRHGDIQAQVVIEGGRIASATIAQCLTRYSCSVIAKLPPEVAERQSPEVDYVSGATQSTNAFYYAVVEALSKAK
jgi:uncharacterized protein with FMN-binding domain